MEFEYVCLKGYCLAVDGDGNVFVFKKPEKKLSIFIEEKLCVESFEYDVDEVEVNNVVISDNVELTDVINELPTLFAHVIR